MNAGICAFAVKVHSEHSYVQNPIMTVHDADRKILGQLKNFLSENGISIYYNHFTVEVMVDDVMYCIGYNDGEIALGIRVASMGDSKEFKVSSPLLYLGW